MKYFWIAILAASLGGQTIVVVNSDESTPLAGVWKQKTGDDLRWADPALDDSSWTSITMPRPAAPGAPGYTWHRIHVTVPADRNLQVLIGPLFPAYEIFANGTKIGSFGGKVGTAAGQHYATPASFALPPGQAKVVLAIRSYDAQLSAGAQSGSADSSTSWIGSREAMAGKIAAWNYDAIRASGYARVLIAGLGFGGLFLLLLPIWRRRHAEFLWCGLLMWAVMGTRIIQFIPDAFGLTRYTGTAAFVVTNLAFFVFWLVFLCALFKTKPTWISLGATAINLLILLPRLPELQTLSILGVGTRALIAMPLAGAVYFEQGWRSVQRQAGFAGIHAVLIAYLVANYYSTLSTATSSGVYAFSNELWTVVLRSPILLLLYAMGVILHQRAAVTEAEQERLKYEVAAAAEVQSLLLPSGEVSGVDAVYMPASEVGGDFYQVLEREDGSRIVAVGDVSGKGLKAAMLVSVAVGALRQSRESSPAAILSDLNRVLVGQAGGGFVTCVCVKLSGGEMVVANAGHPAPYLDGVEYQGESGLPLGVVAGVEYTEAHLAMPALLTLVSDGVVEAASATGELFGFERTREMSTQPAQEIAAAAKAWGQNDDITVVTVRRNS